MDRKLREQVEESFNSHLLPTLEIYKEMAKKGEGEDDHPKADALSNSFDLLRDIAVLITARMKKDQNETIISILMGTMAVITAAPEKAPQLERTLIEISQGVNNEQKND